MRCALLMLGLMAIAGSAAADRLVLKGGRKLEGRIVDRDDGHLVIRTARGFEVLGAATLVRLEPDAWWGAGRLRAQIQAACGAAAGAAEAHWRRGLEHAPDGAERETLLSGLALHLMSRGQLVDAWREARECKDGALAARLVGQVRARVRELEAKLGRTNDLASRRALLLERYRARSIIGAGRLTTELRTLARAAGAASVKLASLKCGGCGGRGFKACATCGGQRGRWEMKTRIGPGGVVLPPVRVWIRCAPCGASGRAACACAGTGLAMNNVLGRRLRALARNLPPKGKSLTALVLQHQLFVPPTLDLGAENPGIPAPIWEALGVGRRLDELALRLPLRRADRDRAGRPFVPAKADCVPTADLARWADHARGDVVTVCRLSGRGSLDAWTERLETELAVDVVAHRQRPGLVAECAGAGRAGETLQTWADRYPVRSVATALARLHSGAVCALYGRLRVPDPDRIDRLAVLEVWRIEILASPAKVRRPEDPPPPERLPELGAPSGTVGRRVKQADEYYRQGLSLTAASERRLREHYLEAAHLWYGSAAADAPHNAYIQDRLLEIRRIRQGENR